MLHLMFLCIVSLWIHLLPQDVVKRSQPLFEDQYGVIIREPHDSLWYYTAISGKELTIPKKAVSFEGGDSALKRFVYSSLPEDNEDNTFELFFLLFDERMTITEIRAVNLSKWTSPNREAYLDEYFKALRRARNWKKEINNLNNYLYVIAMHIQ